MSPRRPEEVQAIAFWLGQSLFVPKDHPGPVFLNLSGGNQPSPFSFRVATGDGKRLGVGVEGRLIVRLQNPGLSPVRKRLRRSGVDVRGLSIPRLGLTKNDPHQIVWASLVVLLPHGRSDLVVRLGHSQLRLNTGRVIAKRAEGM